MGIDPSVWPSPAGLPRPLDQPTVTIRVYAPDALYGTRRPDLALYSAARFTRTRNTVGDFEVTVPLVGPNRSFLNEVRDDWLIEFWSEAAPPRYLFGGYVKRRRWRMEGGETSMVLGGPSYLGWINQRRLIGGTGSKAWAATLGGLETAGYKPPVNQVMYHASAYDPESLNPPTGDRTHRMFRVPAAFPISHVDDRFSEPSISDGSGIPRLTAAEITAFLNGTETLDYLAGRVGDAVNEDTTSPLFGMPRVSYDVIRYDGEPFSDGVTVWPSQGLYLVFRVPGLGVNRTVGSQDYDPVIFDVTAGGVSVAEYNDDSTDVRNRVYVLGVGEKATRARYVYEDADSVELYGLIEDVVDAGQEANPSVIEQKGREYLDERRSSKKSAKFTVSAIPGLVFGYDYGFDDAVTVYWDEIGLTLNEFVSSVSLSLGGNETGQGGIQRTEVVVGDEKLARREAVLGRYLNGLKRGLTNLRV